MARKRSEITLDARGIDEASEAVASFLQKMQLDRANALSVRLSLEDALMRLAEHFGSETTAMVATGTWLGRPRIIIKVRGERFDPRVMEAQSDWERMLLEASGMQPVYTYRGGHNLIVASLPREPLSGTLVTLLAIVLGAAIAYAGTLLPDEARKGLLSNAVTPLFDTFVSMLAGIAGPMVFLSVAWGICGIGDMAALGRNGKALITRFLGADLLATVFALAVCYPLVPLPESAQAEVGAGNLARIVELLLKLLPTNLVKPFEEGNTLQIIVLAVVMGASALALGNETKGIRDALRELNVLFQFLMEQLCRLLPAFIVVMVVYQTWSGMLGELLSSWQPVIAAFACMAIFLLMQVVVIALRSRVPVGRLAKAITPSLLVAFTTASSSAAFSSMLSCCKNSLGIDDDLTSFGIPLGLVLSKAMMAIQIVVLMLFAAQIQGVGADAAWYARLGIVALLYTIAVPPIPGGSLACYGMMLAGLGIPAQVLGILTALDLLLDYPCTTGNVGGLILQVFSAADSLDLVDGDRQARK